MKIIEEQPGQSVLSFATDFSNSEMIMNTYPDEEENNFEEEVDLAEIQVDDDLNEPNPEGDYLADEPYEDTDDDEPDPVPSPS